MRRAYLLICPLLWLGCAPQADQRGGGRVHPAAHDKSVVAEDRGVLPGSGSRCRSGPCACRPIDDNGLGQSARSDAEAEPPPEGSKRFELRTGRGDETVKITVEGMGTFTRSGESPEPACVYVDLLPGATRVRYHVTARDPQKGLEARLRISEYSPNFQRWYRTFSYRCASGAEPCTRADARDALEALGQVRGGKFEACGSTKVQGLRYETDRGADALLGELDLHLVLNVYKFTPRFAPESATCKGTSADAE